MAGRGFTFKQFHINHDRCAMKVGTDGILLGAWTPLGRARRILDVGTGSGLVALMLAQRSEPGVRITGLELDAAAAGQARDNVADSPWSGRVEIVEGALQRYQAAAFDLVVSNPPYFAHGQPFDSRARADARHTGSLSLAELFGHGKRLLAEDGRLCVILPWQSLDEAINQAGFNDLHLTEKQAVITREGRSPGRFLLQFSSIKNCTYVGEIVINTEKNDHGDIYKQMVADFYLKM
ncbi:tRNA (adenosine(37)-N6)-methyltransferase TrmM [Zobellella endophytica]|uniref:tRNA1(Val) (adenine(37)-N6)-methyltransferase n=1 Tax=Zobellella endophytica TaxID=2116700 RepID=A0A2P7QXC9_9GAMM|nr:methyltransferase [Zobellella endophytica]PSJ42621.1 tRNA (adenosine(37)-N6)-methyltransferase TrmM [Zobellella endophytica]